MGYKPLTDEQKRIAQEKLDQTMPSLHFGVRDHNGECAEGQEGWAAFVVETSIAATVGMRPGDDDNLLKLRAHDAGLSVYEQMLKTVAAQMDRDQRFSKAMDLVVQSKAMRNFVRECVAGGDMLDEYGEEMAEWSRAHPDWKPSEVDS